MNATLMAETALAGIRQGTNDCIPESASGWQLCGLSGFVIGLILGLIAFVLFLIVWNKSKEIEKEEKTNGII